MNEWVRLQVQGDEQSEAGEMLGLLAAEKESPWRQLAACKGLDPNLFFPERGESSREAKETCASCPVHDQCGDYALEAGIKYGIFGGQAERQRRRVRRERHLEPVRLVRTPDERRAGKLASKSKRRWELLAAGWCNRCVDGNHARCTDDDCRCDRPHVRPLHAECGTDSGYYRHRKDGAVPCLECKQAHSDANTARSRKKVDGRGRPSADDVAARRKELGWCGPCAYSRHGSCRAEGCTCSACFIATPEAG